jgi:hypothetical protein
MRQILAGLCADTRNGHMTAAPIPVMNSRRCMCSFEEHVSSNAQSLAFYDERRVKKGKTIRPRRCDPMSEKCHSQTLPRKVPRAERVGHHSMNYLPYRLGQACYRLREPGSGSCCEAAGIHHVAGEFGRRVAASFARAAVRPYAADQRSDRAR